jgi:hypothetical protein
MAHKIVQTIRGLGGWAQQPDLHLCPSPPQDILRLNFNKWILDFLQRCNIMSFNYMEG